VTGFLGIDYTEPLADQPGLDGLQEAVVMGGAVPESATDWSSFLARAGQVVIQHQQWRPIDRSARICAYHQ
jgi:hypothetical protein